MRGSGRSGGVAVLLVGVMVWMAGAQLAAAQTDVGGVLQAIDACVLRLNPDVDIGYDRVAARCPALVRRVSESGVSAWLPRDWQRAGNDLSAAGLRELRQSLARELTAVGGAGERVGAPRVERIHDVLASL